MKNITLIGRAYKGANYRASFKSDMRYYKDFEAFVSDVVSRLGLDEPITIEITDYKKRVYYRTFLKRGVK